jgi:ABC-type phosphate transport system substrate-binding protein
LIFVLPFNRNYQEEDHMALIKGRASSFIRTLALTLGMLGVASTLFAADFVVITNKGVSTGSLSKSELQAIFLGEKTKWDDGKHITIVILEDGDINKSFLQDIVEKTPSQYENYWKKLIFTGKATAPKSFNDMSKVVEFVAGQQGSIGYVAAGEAGGTVKTITTK